MLKFDETLVVGWEPAIRGMRNPKNSWDRSDTKYEEITMYDFKKEKTTTKSYVTIGPNDKWLMDTLRMAGEDHRKYLRYLVVYVDITAPLYWWKEYDTYKVGTVANSCSTMHKISAKPFKWEDFSCDKIGDVPDFDPAYEDSLNYTIHQLNRAREKYLDTNDKRYWWQMIQLLPTSYNQKRTVMLNYETLNKMAVSRKGHKLDEWNQDFMDWMHTLPYADELIFKTYPKKTFNDEELLLIKESIASEINSFKINLVLHMDPEDKKRVLHDEEPMNISKADQEKLEKLLRINKKVERYLEKEK